MSDNLVTEFRGIPETEEDVVEELLRLTDPAYGDGFNSPRQSDVDAEQVAFQVFTQGDVSIENELDLSALWIFWGQFMDHDLDLTLEQEGEEAELLKDAGPLSVTRSEFINDQDGVRQQENFITAVMDASNVYGSSQEFLDELRSGTDGMLETSGVGVDGVFLLPTEFDLTGAGDDEAFVAGDRRQTENPALSALHTLWVNEHNFWAEKFATENPTWTDEEIFQSARAIVEALIQKITYEEFLPVLVGDALGAYQGFDDTVDTQVSNEFSTAAFRFGHTAIPNQLTFLDEDGSNTEFEATIVDPFTGQPTTVDVEDGELALLEVFDNQTPIENAGVASVLRGTVEELAQKIDGKVVDGLNLFLFTPDGGLTGFSLPERNILRGRDHGTDTFLNVKVALGLLSQEEADEIIAINDFSAITSDLEVQGQLEGVYGTIDKVDLWVGGIIEDHVPGTTLGETFQHIVADQFGRTRDGDEFYYENRAFSDEIQEIIDTTQLSDVIQRSGGVEHIQRDALLASERLGGTDGGDFLNGTNDRDLIIGFEGNDLLRGRNADDDLFGDEGWDNLYGGRGDDGLDGGENNDRVFGGKGNDHADGGDGNDLVRGNSGDDMLKGGDGNDDIRGGSGEDVIYGGNGNDFIFGGSDADTIVFVEGESGRDIVRGFREEDTLEFVGFGIGFDDLDISVSRNTASIEVDGNLIAFVIGSDARDLTEDDILFS